jgi:hypothetical protein
MHIPTCTKWLGLWRFVFIADARLLSQAGHFLVNFRIRQGMSIDMDNPILKADFLRAYIVLFSHDSRDLLS